MYNRTFIKYFSFFNFHYIAFNPDAINVYCQRSSEGLRSILRSIFDTAILTLSLLQYI